MVQTCATILLILLVTLSLVSVNGKATKDCVPVCHRRHKNCIRITKITEEERVCLTAAIICEFRCGGKKKKHYTTIVDKAMKRQKKFKKELRKTKIDKN